MLRMRLRRVGKKKQPAYRIVIADSRDPRDGDFVESIGHYHPLDNPSTIVIDSDRARHWLDKGAQPSDRVAKLLAIQGIAEIPAKLKTRIELGEQRAKDAAKAKAEAKQAEAAAATEAPKAEAPAAEAPKAEAPAAEAPAAEASAAETPAAEAAEEAPGADAAEEPPAEEPAAEPEQAAEAKPAAEPEQPAEAEPAASSVEEKADA